jgi:hypothetical protein
VEVEFSLLPNCPDGNGAHRPYIDSLKIFSDFSALPSAQAGVTKF